MHDSPTTWSYSVLKIDVRAYFSTNSTKCRYWPSTGPPMLIRTALARCPTSNGKTILKRRQYASGDSALACGLGTF